MKNTIAVASIYSLSLSASRAIAEYYTVRDASPLQSGVNTLPLIISVLIFAVLSGLITSYTGSYKLIMVPASLCMVTGVALMTTLASRAAPRFDPDLSSISTFEKKHGAFTKNQH
ncbi:hypothetical protein BOTNAR_0112g00140 [Botryotinia narcissicola]|uniref:Major facilitator superfamily (MFS) profile domain-containing protein n=1 Tax=Botryotinia narcissicola TaxID=278944 RepID=A0A4Z1IPL0_9HELO|nr:hypothetical protein BOTNAR_0112g00140 [Botryotinia narcissicola]